ncbi:MAG: type II toxin-antitoxin system HicA family toxin [Bacteroidales bacterium]|nr:type II toxin-antitoxin system HicA family toxin [Bacteroidales bacterium]
MRIPRDISGQDLCKKLEKYGYIITKQKGSHIRLTTQRKGEHHITIPNQSNLRIGTLSSIIQAIANHLEKNKEEIVKELFS